MSSDPLQEQYTLTTLSHLSTLPAFYTRVKTRIPVLARQALYQQSRPPGPSLGTLYIPANVDGNQNGDSSSPETEKANDGLDVCTLPLLLKKVADVQVSQTVLSVKHP